MIKMTIGRMMMIAIATVLFISSCRKKDDVSAPDIFANFESNAQGITAAENSITIKLKLTAAAAADIPVVLNVTEFGLAAGTDYNTNPAVAAGKIHLVIPSGNNEASLTLTKVPGKFFAGDEKIIFDLYSSGTPVVIGLTKQLTLTFAELIATTTAQVINGGGGTFPNKVFIDISAERQTAVNRSTWDLGFYSGSDDYRVILNSSSAMMAKPTNKTDLNAVTAADTLGFSQTLFFDQNNPTVTALPFIDYPNGDLTRTAIAAISATAAENKVYIINRGNGVGVPAPARGWKKVRIIRNSTGGYTLQHADIGATSFTSIDIAKDDAYYFKYVSFENGAVAVEPQKKKWDIAWSYFSNVTNFGSGEVPYLFQDVILLNRGVAVSKVMTATKAFVDFGAADVSLQTFSTAQNAIASDWRAGGGPGVSPSIRTDRYYIVKDGDANYYKLRFTALTTTGGERGYPAYEAIWLKKD
ncbi:MAG: hypothetical protein EOO13_11260 [Chitinophagaceae bacterium]|nr:MAG: hypothetical protein EOO13_11260 [Chitinophagaceae bacterium]